MAEETPNRDLRCQESPEVTARIAERAAEIRRERKSEAAGEIAEKAADLVKQEREFHHTGVVPGTVTLGGLAEGVIGSVLGTIVKMVADVARDELIFRDTGVRPTHDALEELRAAAAAETRPPRGALAEARTLKELGIDPNQPWEPFPPSK